MWGFSYGDVLGGGGGWAKSILFNSILRDQFLEFFESDKLALGVCNGCQMISQIKPILPDSRTCLGSLETGQNNLRAEQ